MPKFLVRSVGSRILFQMRLVKTRIRERFNKLIKAGFDL